MKSWKSSSHRHDIYLIANQQIYIAVGVQIVTWIEYTAESYRMWNVKNSDINMTERNRAASLGRDTPMIIKQSDSGPAGITVALDNHLQPKNRKGS